MEDIRKESIMFKWIKRLFDFGLSRNTSKSISEDGVIKFHFPKGKDPYYCPGCNKLMEQGQIFELVISPGTIEAYHRGCFRS